MQWSNYFNTWIMVIILIQPFAIPASMGFTDTVIGTENADEHTDMQPEFSRSARSTPAVIDLNISTAATHPNSTIFGGSGSEAGYSMATGDVDGDGIEDLLVGAPSAVVRGTVTAGCVFMFYGTIQGSGYKPILNITTSADITINGSDTNDRAGSALYIADINSDGFGDILIGAPEADGFNNLKESSGEVYIIYGGTNLPKFIDLDTTSPGSHQNVTFYGNDSFDRFGSSITGADLDSDVWQYDDIVISAPGADGPGNGRSESGEIIVISGNATFPRQTNISTTAILNNDVEVSNVIFGQSGNQDFGLKMLADNICGNTGLELILNSYGIGPGGSGRTGCGEIYIFKDLFAWPQIIDLEKTEPNATIYGQSSGDYAGFAFTVANLNFDNYNDVIIGAPFANGINSERIDAGEVYIIYGNGSLNGTIDLDPELGSGPDVTIYGEGYSSNSDYLGYDIECADYDFDGTADIFISALFGQRVAGGEITGKIYLVSTYYPLPENIDLRTNKTISTIFKGADPDDKAGLNLVSGNLDGSPADDIIIGAPYADGFLNNKPDSGELYVIFGSRGPRPDLRGPVVINTVPENRSTRVRTDQPIVLEFDEPVVQNSFSFDCLPDPKGWQLSWNSTSEKIVLVHNEFIEGILYQFRIKSANDTIGNTFNGEYWYGIDFYTGDFTPPVITSSFPAVNETGINPFANITVKFSEEIKTSSFKFNITPDPGGWLTPEWDPTLTEVSLRHSTAFLELQEYQLEILSTRDTFDNPLSSSDKPLKWKFTTGKKDPVLPWVESVFPADKTGGVGLSTYIEIRFSEPMNISKSVNALVSTPKLTFEKTVWIPTVNALRFWPEYNLLPSTTYSITLLSSAADENGNNLDSNNNQVADGSPADDYKWTFSTQSTGDVKPPTVVAARPAPDSVNIVLNHLIELEFSEPMNKTSVERAFEISPGLNGTFYSFNSFITFVPESDFQPNSTYSVKIRGNAKDRAGNGLDADNDGVPEGRVDDIYLWQFKTGAAGFRDTEPPTVSRTLPENAAKDVAVNTRIEIEFSEEMSWGLAGDSLGVTPSVTGSFKWDGTTLIFTPFAELELNSVYSIRVSAFARDLSGRFLDGDGDGKMEGSPTDDYSYSFTTGITSDKSPPKVVSTIPENNAENILRNVGIEIQFSELMMNDKTEAAFGISPAITGKFLWDEKILIFKPDNVLESQTKYTVTINHLARDIAGNYLDGNSDGIGDNTESDDFIFAFTTSQDYDNTPPKVISTTPQNGSTEVDIYITISINFSEPLNKVYFKNAFSIEPGLPGIISWYGTTMEFSPISKFNPKTVYTVTIDYHAEDLAGNLFDGNGNGLAEQNSKDNYILTFKTGNITIIEFGPKLVETKPADGAKNVQLTEAVMIKFDKPMKTTPEYFMFGCLPDPGGWQISWNDDKTEVTLIHDKFNKNTEYVFTIYFAVAENGIELAGTPKVIKFNTLASDTSGTVDDGTYTIAGRQISYDTLMTILLIIFIWVVIIVIIAGSTLIKMRYEAQQKAEGSGKEKEISEVDKSKEKDKEISDEEMELEEEIRKLREELDEIPPPPEEGVPVIKVADTAEDIDDLITMEDDEE